MNTYVAVFFAAIVLLVIGTVVYERVAAVPSNASTSGTWGGGSLIHPLGNFDVSEGPGPAPDLYQEVQSGPPFYYNPTPAASQNSPSTISSGITNDFDFNALIAEISQPKTISAVGETNNTALNNAYAFLPQGLVGTTTPSEVRTPAELELYDYGNAAGSIVQRFENENPNMAQVLKDQFEDPQNPVKVSALNALAAGLSNVGDRLAKIDPVPTQAASLNSALAADYTTLGTKLVLVGKAVDDQSRVQAMTAYNQAADTFTKHYVSLVLLFSSSGVRFGPNDAGNVFAFAASGL